MTSLNVAIVGAGPAGCTLARLLQVSKAPIKVTIFEGEASLDDRAQGGTLDLHTETGIAALRKAQLYDEFLKFARFDAEAFAVYNKKLRRFVNMGGTTEKNTRGRPEIDRFQLRQLLIRSLDEGTIKWNSRLRRIDEKDNKLTLQFDDRTETGFDLIIAADGAWSKVRLFVSDVKPFYTGISGIQWSIQNPKEQHPEQYKLVNRGSLFAFSDGKSLMAQQMGDGSIGVSSYGNLPEDWQEKAAYDIHNGEAVRKALLEKYESWVPELKQFIEAMDQSSLVARNLYMLPIGHSWAHKPGVTLLGDASHLMSPFGGEGVNLAMKDALDLSTTIISASSNPDSLDERVRIFERAMIKRSTKVQKITYDMMNLMFFTPGAPDSSIHKYISTAVAADMNPVLGAVVTAIIYTYFVFFRLLRLGGGQN